MKIGPYLPAKFKDNYATNARNLNGNTFMIYVGSPQTLNRPTLTETLITNFKGDLIKAQITDFCIHAPYTINLANHSSQKRELSYKALQVEFRNANLLGAKSLVLHPGSGLGQPNTGFLLVECLKNLIEDYRVNYGEPVTKVTLELMPPKGTYLLSRLNSIPALFTTLVNSKLENPHKYIGICLDTCHIWNSGYSISDLETFNLIVKFVHDLGVEIDVIHLNGTLSELGKKPFDRHIPLIDKNSTISLESMKHIIDNTTLYKDTLWILECTKGGDGAKITLDYLNNPIGTYKRDDSGFLIKQV